MWNYMTEERKRKAPKIVHAGDTGLIDNSKNIWVYCDNPECPNSKVGWVIEWIPGHPGYYDEEQARCKKCGQLKGSVP